jgi:hypothetical protein
MRYTVLGLGVGGRQEVTASRTFWSYAEMA